MLNSSDVNVHRRVIPNIHYHSIYSFPWKPKCLLGLTRDKNYYHHWNLYLKLSLKITQTQFETGFLKIRNFYFTENFKFYYILQVGAGRTVLVSPQLTSIRDPTTYKGKPIQISRPSRNISSVIYRLYKATANHTHLYRTPDRPLYALCSHHLTRTLHSVLLFT